MRVSESMPVVTVPEEDLAEISAALLCDNSAIEDGCCLPVHQGGYQASTTDYESPAVARRDS